MNLVGMDATIFLRFTRMCRNMFVILALLGCAILIPINVRYNLSSTSNWLIRITPLNVGTGDHYWGIIVVAWLFNIIVCGFLWYNYTKVVQLRRQYFQSEEYQQSLHARTLMVCSAPPPGLFDPLLTPTLAI